MDRSTRLAQIHNRSTRYEVVADNGTTRVLIGYTIHRSRHGLLTVMRRDGAALVSALQIGETDQITAGKNAAAGFTCTTASGTWSMRFSGRTERDCIMDSELPSYRSLILSEVA